MTAEQELKARELLNQRSSTISPPADLSSPNFRREALKNAEAEARSLLQKRSPENQKPAASPPPSVVEKKAAKTKSKGKETTTAPDPIPLPVSMSKQQRLMQLLEAYKRDEISPAQYHQERAKILAEP